MSDIPLRVLPNRVRRTQDTLSKLDLESIPLKDDVDQVVFKTDFYFDNHIASNWKIIRNELVSKLDQLESFFEHTGSDYIHDSISEGSYHTWPIAYKLKYQQWFKVMFPETYSIMSSIEQITAAAIVKAGPDSGLNPHHGPGNNVDDYPFLRGQTILISDGQSKVTSFNSDGNGYQKTQIEGESWYFDDSDLHCVYNQSSKDRIILIYDFFAEDASHEYVDKDYYLIADQR